MPNKACYHCVFWEDPDNDTDPSTTTVQGACRRFPPQIAGALIRDYQNGGVVVGDCDPYEGHWPWTEPNAWCGEYQAAFHGDLVGTLDLSVRARKVLARLEIRTIGELVLQTEKELLAAKHFGVINLSQVKQELAKCGLSLAEAPDRRAP